MYELNDRAIRAICREWPLKEYCSLRIDVEEWIHSVEFLCGPDMYGIPDAQWLRCAMDFIKAEPRQELVGVGEKHGVTSWGQFKLLLIQFDKNCREEWERLPLWKRHPKYAGAALVIATALVPAAGVLMFAGATSGAAMGSAALAYNCASAVRLLVLPALQSTTTIGATLAGVTATTSIGVIIAANTPGDGHNGNPPPDDKTVPEQYLLSPLSIGAIVKAWNVGMYDPPRTNITSWLDTVDELCEQYQIPAAQRIYCALQNMKDECKKAAHDAECDKMEWAEFVTWVRQYNISWYFTIPS